ncbi:MAG TPA: ABC transporter permease [Gemmatimonadales bacterium]|jgi:ABC-2 type transport system permease protein
MRPSLQRIGELVRKEVRQLLRDPRARAIMFVAPVIQLIVFGYAVNTDIPNTATVIVDHDRTAASRRLIDAFRQTGYFTIVAQPERSSALSDALDDGTAVVGIEIPIGFASGLGGHESARVQIVVDGAQSNSATVAVGYAQRIVQAFGARESGGRELPVIAETRAWFNPALESRTYNVPGVIGVLILLMALLLTSLGVVRERELGTLDQLMVSPLTPAELMVGKTLPVAAIALVDMILISAIAVFWFDIPLRGSPPALLLAVLLYIAAGISIGVLISTVSRTQQEAFMALFLFLLPSIILSGFFFPISSMPRGFQWLTLLNPVRHFLEIIRASFLRGAGIESLWPQYVALGVLSAAALTAAIVRFPRAIRS